MYQFLAGFLSGMDCATFLHILLRYPNRVCYQDPGVCLNHCGIECVSKGLLLVRPLQGRCVVPFQKLTCYYTAWYMVESLRLGVHRKRAHCFSQNLCIAIV